MAIYGRFGCKVTILRKGTLEDVKTLDNRKPDAHDRERVKLGMYLVVRMDEGTVTPGEERLYDYAYLRADGACQEIDAAIKAAGIET